MRLDEGRVQTRRKDWAGHADDAVAHTDIRTIVSWLMDWLVSPAGATELDAMITRSYQNAFGRGPSGAELSYWRGDVRKKKHCWEDLMDFHMHWLNAPTIVTGSYMTVFGRKPTKAESDYWLSPSRRDSVGAASYATIEGWQMDWLLSPAGNVELPAMIRRCYQAVLKRAPDSTELSYWKADVRDKRHTYREIVIYLEDWKKQHGSGPGPSPSASQMVLRVSAPDPGPGVTKITSASFDISGPSTPLKRVQASEQSPNPKSWAVTVPFPDPISRRLDGHLSRYVREERPVRRRERRVRSTLHTQLADRKRSLVELLHPLLRQRRGSRSGLPNRKVLNEPGPK